MTDKSLTSKKKKYPKRNYELLFVEEDAANSKGYDRDQELIY